MSEPVIQADLTPRPVSSYQELWGRDKDTLNAWCKKGWVPGAFKHGSGEWWVRPLELIQWEPSEPGSDEPARIDRPTLKPGKKPVRLSYPVEKVL